MHDDHLTAAHMSKMNVWWQNTRVPVTAESFFNNQRNVKIGYAALRHGEWNGCFRVDYKCDMTETATVTLSITETGAATTKTVHTTELSTSDHIAITSAVASTTIIEVVSIETPVFVPVLNDHEEKEKKKGKPNKDWEKEKKKDDDDWKGYRYYSIYQ
ncbi:hypothetical protein BDA99DRAFT_543378 [Phascolomyces articulosus]|uniref:Uncharacterized protein n=1 Tax=Phascolomyces articulosus TaxID=60185 RepID=A0AAD5JMM9_9FUNG|nr:hypothetical protein BDA99DRAFT_543378 [Phascolomyces articulosus]